MKNLCIFNFAKISIHLYLFIISSLLFYIYLVNTTDCPQFFQLFVTNNTNTNKASRFSDNLNVPYTTHILPNTGTTYFLLEDSEKCYELLNKNLTFAIKDAKNQVIPSCSNDIIDVDLMPYSVFPVNKNILPYIRLNISVIARFPQVQEFYIQFRCIYAPNTADYLCHKHEIQLQKWGKMIWPCRKFSFEHLEDNVMKEKLNLAFLFSYTCYRLFSFSQYLIDIFVVYEGKGRQICKKTFLATIPPERQLDPKIEQFYSGNSNKLNANPLMSRFSPLLYIDNTPNNAIYIHMVLIDWNWSIHHINLSIFYHPTDEKNQSMAMAKRLLNERISLNKHDLENKLLSWNYRLSDKMTLKKFYWRWTDVEPGQYTLYAFIDGHCQLNCASNERLTINMLNCDLCLHTALNLTVLEGKYSLGWKQTKKLNILVKYAAIIVFVTVAFLVILYMAIFVYFRHWRPRILAQQPPNNVELINRPSVLILYTDDCQPHCDAIMALCHTLEDAASARCYVDQKEFAADTTLRPSVWLTEKLSTCDFVLTIFSDCSTRVIAGERMLPRRHFPDLFNMAIGFVISRINEIALSEGVQLPKLNYSRTRKGNRKSRRIDNVKSTSKNANLMIASKSNMDTAGSNEHSLLNKFIFARFSYSSDQSIPDFFTSHQFGRNGPLVLPNQIGALIARLHGILNNLSNWQTNDVQNNDTSTIGQFIHQADMSLLNVSIEAFHQFTTENRDWMDQRFDLSKEVIDTSQITPPLKQHSLKCIPTLSEQTKIAEQFKLLFPDNQEEIYDDDRIAEQNKERDSRMVQSVEKRYEIMGQLHDYDSSSTSS